MTRKAIEVALVSSLPADLVRRLLDNYENSKKHFRAGRVEEGLGTAGRFAEVVFSILHYRATGEVELGVEATDLYRELEKHTELSESERVHIYRAARDIYALRSRRSSAHESDIDPTTFDGQYVSVTTSWILAELIRIFHTDDESYIKSLIAGVIRTEMPLIEEIDGYPVVLDAELPCGDAILCLLYWTYDRSLSIKDLQTYLGQWHSRPKIQGSIGPLLARRLIFRNPKTGKYRLTEPGIEFVEKLLSNAVETNSTQAGRDASDD